MCENCIVIREQMWAEIRDLLNYHRPVKGPMSQSMYDHLEQAKENGLSEDEAAMLVDEMRAELIAVRCAFIARTLPDSQFQGMPPSIVLGAWAGTCMQGESIASILGTLMRLGGDEHEEE